MTSTITTTTERVVKLREYIDARKVLANEFRNMAIGNSVDEAAKCLRSAQQCEDIATGMERALKVLFP